MRTKKQQNMEETPKGKIVISLRSLWLRSRERASALRRDSYTCCTCHKKQTMKKGQEFKVQVHHIEGIEWEEMIAAIRKYLLVNKDKLQTICKECHKEHHKKDNNTKKEIDYEKLEKIYEKINGKDIVGNISLYGMTRKVKK